MFSRIKRLSWSCQSSHHPPDRTITRIVQIVLGISAWLKLLAISFIIVHIYCYKEFVHQTLLIPDSEKVQDTSVRSTLYTHHSVGVHILPNICRIDYNSQFIDLHLNVHASFMFPSLEKESYAGCLQRKGNVRRKSILTEITRWNWFINVNS